MMTESKTVASGEVAERAGSDLETRTSNSSSETSLKAPWWAWIWDWEPNRSSQETKFVRKLDIFLLTMLSLGYFSKNLNASNISNAYVSGMQEDLHMESDQVNLIDTAWTCGYVIVRPSIWIPSCELVWVVLTFCLAAVKTSDHVIAIRFFVGLAESVFYPFAQMMIGSWYKPSELAKRACIFHASSAVASMFSGYLQAAVYKGLNGTGGLPGWKWLFVMDGVICFPIAVAAFFILPDLPENTRAFFLNQEDRELAIKRMNDVGRAPRTGLGWSAFKRIFGRWHVWVLTPLYIFFINAFPSTSINPMALWMKSVGYSVSQRNIIPTAQYAVQLVTTVTFAMASDRLRNRPLMMSVSAFFGFIASLILCFRSSPSSARWYAYLTSKAGVAYGPISLAWTNEICGGDAEERAIVIGVMNSLGYAFNAFVPLLTFPATDAPFFTKGFIFVTVLIGVGWFGSTGLASLLVRRDIKKSLCQEHLDMRPTETDENGRGVGAVLNV